MSDVKISALPAASALTGAELLPIVQSGVTSQSTTGALFASPIAPRLINFETGAGSNAKVWDLIATGSVLYGRTRTDADGAGYNWLAVTRSGTAPTDIYFGDATNTANYHFLNTGGVFEVEPYSRFYSTIEVKNGQYFIKASATANNRIWFISQDGGYFNLDACGDDYQPTAAGRALSFARSGAAVTALSFGNATDNPTYNFLGTGGIGFYGHAVATQQTITGSRGGNAALADLLTKLALTGLIVDGTSA
ncbi:hypothetical protein UFOVP154_39 [uncultured Caudovirales phage]|uniref:Uncharacterized protein n=1 Tax=uncultured Caudovirales phage TaxID=2100421 RepID=A0A6J5KI18_9CAUD|nr:hypothetical protein UFOVP8_24 [uncultured Caudovirales phage]CAB5170654.1 hypothetical protein UFOVP154_39 [uncultured Caudovirales phage]